MSPFRIQGERSPQPPEPSKPKGPNWIQRAWAWYDNDPWLTYLLYPIIAVLIGAAIFLEEIREIKPPKRKIKR
jgi:hypothetical protein